MTIAVTQEHIKQGQMDNCYNCPIALALFDATGSEWFVESRQAARMGRGKQYEAIPLPLIAQEFIRAFDCPREPTPKPFSFELEVRDGQ